VPRLLDLNRNVQMSPKDELKLREPFDYYRSSIPGKGLRRILLQTFNHHLQLPDAWVQEIVNIIEDLHCASLVIDDIEDESTLRRGQLAAHLKHGLAPALNAGNYMYFTVNQRVLRLTAAYGGDVAEAAQIFLDEMVQLHQGQGIEIYWRTKREKPSVREYLKMVEQKTGGLIRLGVRLLSLHPSAQTPTHKSTIAGLIKYGEQLGVYYQIRDDLVSLTSEEYAALNGFAEDLHEGKYSFPIIHSLDVNPHSGLAELLAMKPDDIRMKKAAISLIARTGSFDYTIHALQELGLSLQAQLADLGGNERLEGLLRSWTIKAPPS